jgi:hypothetical protein
VAVVAVASSSSKGTTKTQASTPTGPSSAAVNALNEASTSSRGVTATSINVVLPVSNLTTLSSNFGFAGGAEFSHQVDAIHTFVNAANANGGINDRKINPMIVNFDPTDQAGMRALCKQWTEGNPPSSP